MALKLARLDSKPTKEKKITLTLPPMLAHRLDLYGEAYATEYGVESPNSEDLALAILDQFLEADAGFRAFEKEKTGRKSRRTPKATP